MDPQVIIDRFMRMLRLDTSVFEEMRDDPNGTWPAIGVAVVSFFIAGLGGFFWWIVEGYPDKGKLFTESVLAGTAIATAAWVGWIAIAYFTLVNLFHYTGNLERCLRACGFATVPAVLMIIMLIPGIDLGIGLAALALVFLLMDIGIQVSFDAQPGHVILATFLGFAGFCLLLAILVGKDRYFAPGVFLFRVPAPALSDLVNAFSTTRIPRLP